MHDPPAATLPLSALAHFRRYRASDAREASHLSRMLDLARDANAAQRSHFEPGHFTASAFVLSPDRRELCMIYHKKLGLWLQPGGHLERCDADLPSAARREVAEEVGLFELEPFGAPLAPFDLDIHVIPARKYEPRHEHFDVRFAFVARTRDLSLSEEVADGRWVPLREVPQATRDESVRRALRKLSTALGLEMG